MKIFLIVLTFVMIGLLNASPLYGPSVISLEKTWTIEAENDGTHIELDGIFIINGSTHQVVKEIELSEGMKIFYDKDGAIKARYNGTINGKKKILKATAIVEVFYKNGVPPDADSNVDENEIEGQTFTAYTKEMKETAESLAERSSLLNTVRNITEWVHDYITYVIGYFGKNVPAKVVFRDRRGVCVEYSHLFISFAKSLGIKTRYISGYVMSKEWQPHSWVEVFVPKYGWLPIDATFNEAGTLDNSHVMMFYSEDQEGVVDKIISDKTIKFDSTEELKVLSSEASPEKLVDLQHSFNESDYSITVTLHNKKDKFVFVTYEVASPPEFGLVEERLLLLEPDEEKIFRYILDKGKMKDGFVYNIPLRVTVNDYVVKDNLVIVKDGKDTKEDIPGDNAKKFEIPSVCGTVFVMLATLFAVLMVRKNA